MTMNDFTDCKSTIEKISEDTEHQVTIHNKTECFNFDKVKEQYLKSLGLKGKECKSIDGLLLHNNIHYFIEFKNGTLTDKKHRSRKIADICLKIKASVIIYCDITDKHISDMRKTDEFILVYNEENNPLHNNESPSNIAIKEYFTKKSGNEFIRFALERYDGLYFKSVHTYTEKEFEKFMDELQK
ncbi:MAG: hypothetical protein P1P63_02770 [Treponemataceae bacterium]